MELYIFNPDADLALAHGGENYIAPASARRMAADLAILPAWYACEGDAVLAPSAYNADFLQRMHDVLGLDIKLATYPELSDYAAALPVPWGWNLALRRQLVRGGFPLENLPSADTLHAYRRWASREQVAGCLSAFKDIPFCRGESWNLKDLSACRAFVECQGHTLLKAPWSGSGKGLCWCASGFTRSVSGWCARVLREQGCVVASPVYDKVADFAMEFYSDGSSVKFKGYSVFYNNAQFSYDTALVASEEMLEQKISSFIDREDLLTVREMMEVCLTHYIAPAYIGDLGVDMMIYNDSGKSRIMPIVEVNMRTTMGMVAAVLGNKIVEKGKMGKMSILFHKNPDIAKEYLSAIKKSVIKNGRLVAGGLSLVPQYSDSQYTAVVEILE